MAEPVRILLQTTILTTDDDWHIGRFSRLRDHLAGLPGLQVTARDRAVPGGETDPVLGSLDTSDFDQLWLFAVDVGDGLNAEECAAIGRFRSVGGGLMVTRDHMDLGVSVCTLGGVGKAHHFHTRQCEPGAERQQRDDPYTTNIDWPNYHSGANGDVQAVATAGAPHPLFAGVGRLPSHPHEGAVSAPPDEPQARVVATGRSKATGRTFNIAVAFEAGPDGGRALAQSTFHHFCDYNLDPRDGCPTFVDEPPGDEIVRDPSAQAEALHYFTNVASWLGRR